MKKSNVTIGNRNHDLPGWSAVLQPTAPPRAVLREILGKIQFKKGWRIKSNNEFQKLIKEDIVKYIKAQGIKWWGHLSGTGDVKLVEKITEWNPTGVRTKE